MVEFILFIIVAIIVLLSTYTYLKFKSDYNYLKNGMSFKESMDLVNLPVITFYQGDNKFHFLLDTGSNNNIINKSVLTNIKSEPINKENTIIGLEGTGIKSKFVAIEFQYKSTNYEAPFQVVNMDKSFNSIKQETGVTVHGIIGSIFFKKYKYVLDFDKLIAYSKK